MNRNRQKYYYHSQAIYRAPIMCKSYLVSIVRHRNVRQCPCSESAREGGGKEGGREGEQPMHHGSVYFRSNECCRQCRLQRVEIEIVSSWPL